MKETQGKERTMYWKTPEIQLENGCKMAVYGDSTLFSGEGYEVNSENALFLSIYEQLSPLSNE